MNLKNLTVRTTASILFIGASLLLWHLLSFSAIPAAESELGEVSKHEEFNEHYRIFSIDIPSSMEFCGETIPLEKLHVRESLDRELLINTYWQSSSILNHKRASRWLPLIEEVLQENNMPEDLKYIAVIESGLRNVVSPAGATGYWQFLRQTGKEFGLEISGEVDERYHVRKSTEAACKYLRSAYEKYGSWVLAAASYNMGMNGLTKQMARQKTDSYFELLLVEETSRYLYRALALKEILNKPEHYGFHLGPNDLYKPYRTSSVTINGPIPDFADFAHKYGTDYKTLKLLNPWLRENFLTNKYNRTYTIELPAEDFDQRPSEK